MCFVLDLEPHGPLPTQIYWRRRALAIGVAVLVIGVIAAIVVVVVKTTGGSRRGRQQATTACRCTDAAAR